MPIDLHGKTVIITGASRGIGKNTAVELGRRGANVVVAARTVTPRNRLPGTIGETLEAIEATGAQALAVPADMAEAEDLDHLVAATMERFGGIDVLINNAAATGGRSWGASLLELTREEWMWQYAVNLHAPFTLIRTVVPIMAASGGGRVINLTSGTPEMRAQQARVAGQSATETAPGPSVLGSAPLAYPSSKAALDTFCVAVAPQLRELGVSIVNVNPGAVHTELVDVLAERGLATSSFIPMDIPTGALAYLATCDDPMALTGHVVTAQTLLQELGLS